MAKQFYSSSQFNPNLLTAIIIEIFTKNIQGGDILKTLAQRETFRICSLRATDFPGS